MLEENFAWGKVNLTIWTHKIKGLYENEFILAGQDRRTLAVSIHNSDLDIFKMSRLLMVLLLQRLRP